jgi:hypothetical protein
LLTQKITLVQRDILRSKIPGTNNQPHVSRLQSTVRERIAQSTVRERIAQSTVRERIAQSTVRERIVQSTVREISNNQPIREILNNQPHVGRIQSTLGSVRSQPSLVVGVDNYR